jgi:hypothetical protein
MRTHRHILKIRPTRAAVRLLELATEHLKRAKAEFDFNTIAVTPLFMPGPAYYGGNFQSAGGVRV